MGTRQQYLTEDGRPTCVRAETTLAEDVTALHIEMADIGTVLPRAVLDLGSELAGWTTSENALRQYMEVVSGVASVLTQVDDVDGLRAKVLEQEAGR